MSDKIVVKSVKNSVEAELLTESKDGETAVTGVVIKTPELPFVDAVNQSTLIASRIVDYLAFEYGVVAKCYLKQINEIGSPDQTKMGAANYSTSLTLVKPSNIDLTKPSVVEIIKHGDSKLARQLSRYIRGISTQDPIEQIREFYQVLEDDGHPATEGGRYKYVRHLVSHSELSDPDARRTLGRSHIDPNSPEDLKQIEQDAIYLKEEARNLIHSKLT